MVTYHPTFKRTNAGFLPMVNIRATNGQMLGSRVARDNVCETEALAISEAYVCAFRAAGNAHGCARVA